MKQTINFIISLVLIAIGLAVIIWFMLAFNMYFADVRDVLLRQGNLEFFIYSLIFVSVFVYILRKLLLWEVNILFPHGKKEKGR